MSTALAPNREPWIPDDTFGARLAQVRQHFGWNQKEAALACGIQYQSWRRWEAGSLPHKYEESCRQIADITEVDLTWLLRGWGVRNRCFSENPACVGQTDHQPVRHLSLVEN